MKAKRFLTYRQRVAKLPKTVSQVFVRKREACIGGRERLGKLSLGQYWRTASGRFAHLDLRWIARNVNLLPSEMGPTVPDAVQVLLDQDTRTVVQFRKRAAGSTATRSRLARSTTKSNSTRG